MVLGAASASQAGIRFNVGLGLPLPPLPVAVVNPLVPVCAPAPVVVAPQVCEPVPVIIRHSVYERHYHYDSRHYTSARWDHYRGR